MDPSWLKTDAEAAHLATTWDSMEGLPPTRPPGNRVVALFLAAYPGLLVASVIAIAAVWLSQHYGAPVMLFALTFGMAFHFLHEEGRCIRGVEFASRTVLRTGVALLGARITIEQIMSLGWTPIVMVVVGVTTTLGLGLVLGRLLRLGPSFGLLSGGSVGICGASAALAIASILPKTKESERDVILVVVVVTTLSTVAMIVYPVLVSALGLGEVRAGLFLGGTIHDVAQVVGAGYMVSQVTGDTATYVKLLRVALLLPVVFAIAAVMARRRVGGPTAAPLPGFLIGFALLVALNSLGVLPKAASDLAGEASRWCLVVAISALGIKTSFKAVLQAGWRPVAAIVLETVWIAGLVLVGVEWLT
ncbi:MAG: putative sulfate exporter family transporter [Phenylobacterium sp.]|uniref:YeiH family protein n=1 Tax=Phenylobacterium sp. TaxID=1871053 RepID=UPI002736672A|nr:putative sulfate exporter family transporter [Phenylobacterium sp.]MDP3747666.1 putative sulfate exporter family transporter [Phenylobacterium sp.]